MLCNVPVGGNSQKKKKQQQQKVVVLKHHLNQYTSDAAAAHHDSSNNLICMHLDVDCHQSEKLPDFTEKFQGGVVAVQVCQMQWWGFFKSLNSDWNLTKS
jgi:hypothetical protein